MLNKLDSYPPPPPPLSPPPQYGFNPTWNSGEQQTDRPVTRQPEVAVVNQVTAKQVPDIFVISLKYRVFFHLANRKWCR